jgi:hypothetical protein
MVRSRVSEWPTSVPISSNRYGSLAEHAAFADGAVSGLVGDQIERVRPFEPARRHDGFGVAGAAAAGGSKDRCRHRPPGVAGRAG